MPPWRFATRTRKAATSYASRGPVTFLAPQRVGRTGKWDESGRRQEGRVQVVHVPVGTLVPSPGKRSMALNLLKAYVPALVRLARVTMTTPADVVHVTGAPLIPLALLHQKRYHSTLILDINERPASVASQGSLFSTFSRIEPALLRAGARAATITTVVTEGHAELLRDHHNWTAPVLVVRNAPNATWRAVWTPPPEGPLRVVTVGTIFERRGFELIIEAARICRDSANEVEVHIHGSGRPEYLSTLRQLITDHEVTDLVQLHPSVSSDNVSSIYLTGHLGLAFYEPSDPGNDSLSNKIIECIASGRPVLAGDLPENRRFIQENDCGWLTELTSEAIAQKLIALTTHGDLLKIAARCRDIASQLTWESEFNPVIEHLTATLAHEEQRTRQREDNEV